MLQAQPLFTELPIRGLKAPFTILQITDVHACALSPEEEADMPAYRRAYALQRRRDFSGGRADPPEDALPVLFDYAAEAGADLILLTGDFFDCPSEGNMACLEACIRSASAPCLLAIGNHDPYFADDYRTGGAAATYLPRMDALAGGDHRFAMKEFEHIIVAVADNDLEWVSEDVADAYTRAVRYAASVGKPLVLGMHIPLSVDTLTADCIRFWGRDICLGPGATGGWNAQTLRFHRIVTESHDLAPAAVIAGHLHIDHEDVFPNGVPQIVTDIASGGHCRVIRLCPAEQD